MNGIEPTVVILIDALGYEIVRKHGFKLPIGGPKRLKTVAGFSQAAILSILTSLSPADHGMWLMYSFNRDKSPMKWTRLLPNSVSSRRLWFRRLVSWKLERVDRISSYYSLYDIPREVLPYLDIPLKKSYFEEGAIGGVRSIFDHLASNRIPYKVWDYTVDEGQAFSELTIELERGEPGFYFLYTAEFDALLHRYGTTHEVVAEKLAWYENKVSELFEKAVEKFGAPRFFVFGDHGMCDVEQTVDVQSKIERLGFKIPQDYLPFYDSTMARFKIFSSEAAEGIEALLRSTGCGHIVDDMEAASIGAPGPGSPYGDIVFIVDSGCLIVPSFMSKSPISAMHGYHPDSSCMDSSFFANQKSIDIESIVEIAHLMIPNFKVEKGNRDGD
ncbi:MAG: hypothetical protein B6D63_06565 [Candidatus Latescibacteria bacterium 4484_7]|nr:MAG: hypothetical protein B6D63_06565 [Candidatus Latescibacteria bacterium 4484_7]